jgi:hypothetical protein
MTVRVTVEQGTGKWAYWKIKESLVVVADEVCNPGAVHFAGMLGQPVNKTPCEAELHTEGFSPERNRSVWEKELDE